ncbi:MAG: M48 family metallopeptidase [Candidatus Omnitrophota bacterium]|nr:MAG: M48 family metallopeptidase [Candidatus Omnitrophota bacterium]
MNIFLIIILAIIVIDYILDSLVGILNVRHAKLELPQEFAGWYDAGKYKKSQEYLKTGTRFSIVKDTFFTALIIAFILGGGFNYIDKFARQFGFGSILTGLVFGAVVVLIWELLSIPFAIYSTFVIEERFGFNRTTPKTFVFDFIKSLILLAIIGGSAFAAVIWFFRTAGSLAWLYCWIALTLFQLFLIFIAPVVIMPLFNKFKPLAEGELKEAIQDYARSQNFKMKGIYTMDGSRRSSKANAFFTGFGRFRRIALFDTLIQKHTAEELVLVLAHEVGHYKKKHILKMMFISIITSGLMFYLLSFFINNPMLFAAFRMENLSVYGSLFFFGFLYAPISMIFSIIHNILSRKNEYQADSYAVKTYPKPEVFIAALKKLTIDNLSNLTPHPLKVFLDYSHPPILERIKALRTIKIG